MHKMVIVKNATTTGSGEKARLEAALMRDDFSDELKDTVKYFAGSSLK